MAHTFASYAPCLGLAPGRFRIVYRMREDFAEALSKSDTGRQIVEAAGGKTIVAFRRTKVAALKLAREEGEPSQHFANVGPMSHVEVFDDDRGGALLYRSPGHPHASRAA